MRNTMRKTSDERVTHGSGNVFADIGIHSRKKRLRRHVSSR